MFIIDGLLFETVVNETTFTYDRSSRIYIELLSVVRTIRIRTADLPDIIDDRTSRSEITRVDSLMITRRHSSGVFRSLLIRPRPARCKPIELSTEKSSASASPIETMRRRRRLERRIPLRSLTTRHTRELEAGEWNRTGSGSE